MDTIVITKPQDQAPIYTKEELIQRQAVQNTVAQGNNIANFLMIFGSPVLAGYLVKKNTNSMIAGIVSGIGVFYLTAVHSMSNSKRSGHL